MTERHHDRVRLVAANEDAADFYRDMLLGPEGEGPRRYLTDRGFESLLEQTPWTVGYAPSGWTHLRDHLNDLGYSDETLVATGLTRISRRGTLIDCFRDRITFGIRDRENSLVGFTARCCPTAPEYVPKYLNTTATAIYDKSTVLFGFGEAINLNTGDLVLTEGPLDAIAVQVAQRRTSHPVTPLALCGTSSTDGHGAAIEALGVNRIILAFDDDDAGRQARETAFKALRGTVDIEAIVAADGRDLADILKHHGPEGVARAIADHRPAVDAIIDARLASWPHAAENAEAAVACLRSLARLVSDLRPPDMARQTVRLREATQLPTAVVSHELAEAVTTAH